MGSTKWCNRHLTLDNFFYYYKPQKISSSKGIYHFLARKMSLRLVFDMPNSNRNRKNIYFFVQGMDQVCRPKEWDSMPRGFDNTLGIVRESGVSSIFIFYYPVYFCFVSNTFSFLAQARPQISDEQEGFIRHVLEIPFEQRKWKDLVTLDTFHAFCGGLEPTLIARQLHTFPCCCDIHVHSFFSPSLIFLTFSINFFKDKRWQAEGIGEEVCCHVQAVGGGVGWALELHKRGRATPRMAIRPRRGQAHLLLINNRSLLHPLLPLIMESGRA